MDDMEKALLAVFAVMCVIILIAGFGLLLAFPIKWCWNYTMPMLFDLHTVTWGHAWCLYFLAGCLIKATQTSKT